MVGIVESLILFVYAMVAAVAEGRPLWVSYPFMIPLLLMCAKRYAETLRWQRDIGWHKKKGVIEPGG